jgi:hypothetical protein
MSQYDDFVVCQTDIRLDGMCAYLDGGTEGSKCVLWEGCFVASVTDSLR